MLGVVFKVKVYVPVEIGVPVATNVMSLFPRVVKVPFALKVVPLMVLVLKKYVPVLVTLALIVCVTLDNVGSSGECNSPCELTKV